MTSSRAPTAETRAPTDLVILGGSNLIASYLLRRVEQAGRGALVVARRLVTVEAPNTFQRLDALDAGGWHAPAASTVISILPLATLVVLLPHLISVSAIVAIGSTSVLSKANSPDSRDRDIATRLAASEVALKVWCDAHRVTFTILRPTLVYDGIGDRNIARMARVIRRYGVLPIVRPANGRRQPVHADDIAKAILACLGNPPAANRTFDIAGGEVLTYRAMAERVFAAEGRRPRFLVLPQGLLEAAYRVAVALRLLRPDGVGVSTFRRMNQDLVFDVRQGLEVLDYAPRGFEPKSR